MGGRVLWGGVWMGWGEVGRGSLDPSLLALMPSTRALNTLMHESCMRVLYSCLVPTTRVWDASPQRMSSVSFLLCPHHKPSTHVFFFLPLVSLMRALNPLLLEPSIHFHTSPQHTCTQALNTVVHEPSTHFCASPQCTSTQALSSDVCKSSEHLYASLLFACTRALNIVLRKPLVHFYMSPQYKSTRVL